MGKPGDKPAAAQPFQPVGEDIGGDAFAAVEDLAEFSAVVSHSRLICMRTMLASRTASFPKDR